jgi:hypothetical protein
VSPPAPNAASSCSFNQPSTSTKSPFTPYEPPNHYSPHAKASQAMIVQQEHDAHELPQVKKMDPYEEGKYEYMLVNCDLIKTVGSPKLFYLFLYIFIEEMEKSLLRSLSPVKKDESNEAINFLNSVLSKTEENPMIFPSIHREDSKSISRTASTFDGRISSSKDYLKSTFQSIENSFFLNVCLLNR